jgi:hypothetical protein
MHPLSAGPRLPKIGSFVITEPQTQIHHPMLIIPGTSL